MIYRTAINSEYRILADIHNEAFGSFFLTSLGIRFLRVYYKASLKSKNCIATCALSDEGEIIGFCLGSFVSHGHHTRLIASNAPLFILEGLLIIFSKPLAILRLLRNLDKKIAGITDDGNYSELLSIGVRPAIKGKGIGSELIRRFENEIVKRGGTKICLTTDYFDNDGAIAFYRKSGYEVFYEFTTYPDRKMIKLVKYLQEHKE